MYTCLQSHRSWATDSKKFRTLTPLLKTHISSIHHLLQNLADDATLRLTLTSITPLLPYILSFKKAVGDLIKTVVVIWSSSTSTEATRIAAFLILRRLVVIGDPGIRENVLKATYQGLVKGSRNTTVHTIKGVNLMKNSAAELWGLDRNVGYTTGFTFIRQLAIHLRSSITNPTKDSYKAVYNWQYVHSLDFWSRVLAEHCSSLKEAEIGKDSPLRPLIYPTVQVTMGAMRLIPTSQYFPLRFQLIRSLLRISRATTTYIPLAPALFEVLSSKEMKRAPRPGTLKPLDFSINIRAPKAYLKTRVYQDGLGEQVTELLSEFFILWCKNIAFPELALPVLVMLKRWLKEVSDRKDGNKNGKVNSAIILLVQKLESNSRWIEEKRAKVEFAPNNRAGVEGFLKEVEWEKTPLGAFVVGQRASREEREKVLEAGRRADEKKRKARGEASDDDPVEGGGGFEDAESGEDEVESEEE
jgi:nucleolar complex protein 2